MLRQAIAAAPAPEQTSLTVLDPLADDLQSIEDGGGSDNRGPMLVVVENRDLHALPQPRLDDEALGRLDVLQVDAAEGRLQARDDLNQLVGIGFVDLDIEHVDAGELFEQAALALHHGLAGKRADVAEPQHRRAVGDHRDEVGARGQVGGLDRVVLDGHAGRRNPRRIGQRQIALRGHVLRGQDRDFSRRREAMIVQGRLGSGRRRTRLRRSPRRAS